MRPFLFDTHFPAEAPDESGPSPLPRPEPSFQTGGFTEEDLEAVRDRAFKQGMELGERDGFERGQQAARQSLDAQRTQALAGIDTAMKGAMEDVTAFRERLEHDTVRVVTALVARLAPPLLDAVADAELDSLVLDMLRAAIGRPLLEIRVSPVTQERLQADIDTMAANAGYRGDVRLIADASLTAGAAVADWGTGGAQHDPRALERALADAVAIAISRLGVHSRAGR